jgi:secernin
MARGNHFSCKARDGKELICPESESKLNRSKNRKVIAPALESWWNRRWRVDAALAVERESWAMMNDMVVALARATADGHTLFGHNSNHRRGRGAALVRTAPRDHAPGEMVQATHLLVPQARHTHGVLAGQTGGGFGYQHGVNDRGVAVAWTAIRTRLLEDSPCLTGPDLVRLTLERAGSALQAVEVLTDLIGRYGQGPFVGGEDEPDAALLVADGNEAQAIEATGRHWALANIGSVRAVSNACFLRKDWDRISRGLSDLAIRRGWWPEDGCKLDFAGALALPGVDRAPAMRRWGRATMHLEQHSGAIDGAFLRRLMRELAEAVCPESGPVEDVETAASLIVRLGPTPQSLPIAWCAFGPPTASVYLPVTPVADLPALYVDHGGEGSPLGKMLDHWHARRRRDDRLRGELHSGLAGLQEQLDELTHEFAPGADELHRRGKTEELRRLAESFMQHTCERFEDLAQSLGAGTAGEESSEAGGSGQRAAFQSSGLS